MNIKLTQTIFFLALFGGVILVTFFLFKPYLGALFIAMVFAIMFEPLFNYISRYLKSYRSVASLLTVTTVLFVILLPLSYIGVMLFQEAKDLSLNLLEKKADTSFLSETLSSIEASIQGVSPDIEINLNPEKYLESIVLWLTDNLGKFFSGLAGVTMNIFLMIIALFFFLRDGNKLKDTIVKWSPLADNHDEGILKKMTIAVNSVIKGDILIAIIQGLLAGIGFVIFGLPSPVLWGAVATITALIPTVGAGIVIIPAVIYIYFLISAPMALGLLIWGIVVVGTIDNYLRPTLLNKNVNIHPFILLLSVFGGLSLFGPIGFLVGPIVISFLFALIETFPDVMNLDNSK